MSEGVAVDVDTPPETNSSHLPGNYPKRKRSSSNHAFLGAFAVSFREGSLFFFDTYPRV